MGLKQPILMFSGPTNQDTEQGLILASSSTRKLQIQCRSPRECSRPLSCSLLVVCRGRPEKEVTVSFTWLDLLQPHLGRDQDPQPLIVAAALSMLG